MGEWNKLLLRDCIILVKKKCFINIIVPVSKKKNNSENVRTAFLGKHMIIYDVFMVHGSFNM